MVLPVCVTQQVIHARKVKPVERYGMRGRKRDPIIVLNRLRNHLTTRSFDNERMKLLVHIAVASLVRLHQMAFGKNFVAFSQAVVEVMQEPARWSLLREDAGRQSL